MEKVRLAIIFDPMSEDYEQELVCQLFDEFCIPYEVVAEGMGIHEIGGRDVDILVIDYGGMSVMGGHDTSLAQVRAAYRWAEEHPSGALVIWTLYTQYLYEEVLEESKEIPNVFLRSEGETEDFFAQLKRWIGIQ